MIEWIVSASILIAVIIALRYILRGKISLRLQYALWALVLLRLLVPVSFGNTGLSVMNVVPEANSQIENLYVDAFSQYSVQQGGVKIYSGYGAPSEDIVNEAKASGEEYSFAYTSHEISIAPLLRLAWLAGTAVMALWLLASNLRFFARLRRSRRTLNVSGCSLPVYVSELIDTPCLFGLFRPAIYITPEATADDTVFRHTVEHELTHFRHGDQIWSLLRGVCLALHWYNPLVWWAAVLSRNDSELACDEATIKRIGENKRAEYGRTLIEMTCQKRPALLLTATTMTGSKSSIKERIMLIAKKPKMAVYTLVAVILIAAVAVGCTFTGARGDDVGTAPDTLGLTPDTVAMSQPLSSAFSPDAITDADTVEYLWNLYQNFTFDGTAKTISKENVWSIAVVFSNSATGESESFTISQGGLCLLGEDYEIYHILVDGANIYDDFLRCFEEAKNAGKQSLSIKTEVEDDIPSAAIDYAVEYTQAQLSYYTDEMGYEITEAKIVSLTQISTGTAGQYDGINMYLLEYRFLPADPGEVILAGGMQMEEGYITEWGSTGQPCLLLHWDDSGEEMVWERICTTNTLTIHEEYGTPEMLSQYGDMYTAAAMELYGRYISGGVEDLIIDILSADGAYAEKAQYALIKSLINDSVATLEAIGARAEGICDWLCWSVASGIRGMGLDTVDALSGEGLSENGLYACERIVSYFSINTAAPKSWRQVYLDFWNETLFSQASDGEIVGIGLMDFNFDGVPELIAWQPAASTSEFAVLYYTDGVQTYHNIGSGYTAVLWARQLSDYALTETPPPTFWLVKSRETGAYYWCVHSQNGQDDNLWGGYQLLYADDRQLVGSYETEEGAREAWEAFDARYEIVDLDYSAFVLSVLAGDSLNAGSVNALLNSWRPLN